MHWNGSTFGRGRSAPASRWMEEAKETAGLHAVAGSLGYGFRSHNRFGPCPACGATRTRKDARSPVSLTCQGHRWRCWSCEARGSVIDLVAWSLHGQPLEMTDRDAVNAVRDWFRARGYVGGPHGGR